MRKFKKSQIKSFAKQLTHDSELFGDEVMSVIAQLTLLSNTANEYGCKVEGMIANGYGNSIAVAAMPDKYQHCWEF